VFGYLCYSVIFVCLLQLSVGSETPHQSGLIIDESSNDALVIVDDAMAPTNTPTPKKSRGRGRPKGSGTGRGRPRGRGGTKRALSAAEIAGAQAGMTAAYKAYGYNYKGMSRLVSEDINQCLFYIYCPDLITLISL